MNCIITRADSNAGTSHPIDPEPSYPLARSIDFRTVPQPYQQVGHIWLHLQPEDVHDLVRELLDDDCGFNDIKAMRQTATDLRRTIKATVDSITDERQDWTR